MTVTELHINGWNVGFQKIEFTKLLQQELGLSLSLAKGMTDRVLEGNQVAIKVPENDLERISVAMADLGAKLHRNTEDGEIACQ